MGGAECELEDLNLYVGRMVTKWSIDNGKYQTPNLQMEVVGTLSFDLKKSELSEETMSPTEITESEKRADKIVLLSNYETQALYYKHPYDPEFDPFEKGEEITDEVRKKNLEQERNTFIKKFFAYVLHYFNPSDIITLNKENYKLPFGKLTNVSQDPFKYEFELHIEKNLFTEEITNFLNLIDNQKDIKWTSIKYIYLGKFNFDNVRSIVKERSYTIRSFDPTIPCLEINIKPKNSYENLNVKIMTEPNTSIIEIYQDRNLSNEFFQSSPIIELLEIFLPALEFQ